MQKRLTVYFSGTVQGVGFRYTAERLSRHFNISGYVRNLPDGRVELVAEGDEAVLQDFLTAVRESDMKSYIRNVNVDWENAKGEFAQFGIRF